MDQWTSGRVNGPVDQWTGDGPVDGWRTSGRVSVPGTMRTRDGGYPYCFCCTSGTPTRVHGWSAYQTCCTAARTPAARSTDRSSSPGYIAKWDWNSQPFGSEITLLCGKFTLLLGQIHPSRAQITGQTVKIHRFPWFYDISGYFHHFRPHLTVSGSVMAISRLQRHGSTTENH